MGWFCRVSLDCWPSASACGTPPARSLWSICIHRHSNCLWLVILELMKPFGLDHQCTVQSRWYSSTFIKGLSWWWWFIYLMRSYWVAMSSATGLLTFSKEKDLKIVWIKKILPFLMVLLSAIPMIGVIGSGCKTTTKVSQCCWSRRGKIKAVLGESLINFDDIAWWRIGNYCEIF